MDTNALINIIRAHTAYIMDIQRQHMCKVTKANRKRFIDTMVKNGVSKIEATYIADNDE